jgi:hypothetical protein
MRFLCAADEIIQVGPDIGPPADAFRCSVGWAIPQRRLESSVALPQARARVDRFLFGPPVGFPVQFRVVGPDPMKVRAIAEEVR